MNFGQQNPKCEIDRCSHQENIDQAVNQEDPQGNGCRSRLPADTGYHYGESRETGQTTTGEHFEIQTVRADASVPSDEAVLSSVEHSIVVRSHTKKRTVARHVERGLPKVGSGKRNVHHK